jgi:hypothetical protein
MSGLRGADVAPIKAARAKTEQAHAKEYAKTSTDLDCSRGDGVVPSKRTEPHRSFRGERSWWELISSPLKNVSIFHQSSECAPCSHGLVPGEGSGSYVGRNLVKDQLTFLSGVRFIRKTFE